MTRIMSVSLAAFDGIPLGLALDSLAGCGIRWIEPAFIVGYTEPFDQTAFTPAAATFWARLLQERQLGCHAMSAHIDLGLPDAVDLFRPRMDFARQLGARIINTNASLASHEERFRHNIEILARHGEELGLAIGLENPGNGEDNLLNFGQEGEVLLATLGLPAVGLNFDAANLASHRPDCDVTRNTLDALPHCIHYHVKDVARRSDGWHFTTLGAGDIDNATILQAIVLQPDLPVSIELPLRLRRGPDAQPVRAGRPLPLATIEAAIKASLDYLHRFLPEA
jgi:sugar phosphate isomerase/epimerase